MEKEKLFLLCLLLLVVGFVWFGEGVVSDLVSGLGACA